MIAAAIAIVCFVAGFFIAGTQSGTDIFAVNSQNQQANTTTPAITPGAAASAESSGHFYYITSTGCSSCESLKPVASGLAKKLGVAFSVHEYTKKMSMPGYVLIYNDKLTINGIQNKYSLEQTICDITNKKEICDMAVKDKPASTMAQPADVPKSDKPKVELFIMSHCPPGLQMEKALIPAMETLGDKADIEVKWVNYAMHGEKEVQDNTREYCIQKEQKSKFTDYVRCFVKAGDANGCIDKVGIDKQKLEKCINETDSTFGITAGYNDKSKWKGRFPPYPIDDALNKKYGVRGSPTFVINGKTVSVSRSPKAVLDTICSAFNNPPSECKTNLSSSREKPGFGEIGTSSGST